MLIEGSYLDYLTLSEPYQSDAPPTLYQFSKTIATRGKDARRLGYQGNVYTFRRLDEPTVEGSFFFGERDWHGKRWGLLVASGESAHWLIQHIWQTGFEQWAHIRCTRIDVQCTVLWPQGIFYLRHLPLSQDVTATTVHGLTEDTDWSETVYLGSRSAPVLVRAYRKRIDQSGQDWLRVEVEYKKQASERLFILILGEGYVGNWFKPVLERCSELYAIIEGFLNDDPERPKTVRVVGNTYHWLSTTVANCVCRLLNDDDLHEQVMALVSDWYSYGQACTRRRIVV